MFGFLRRMVGGDKPLAEGRAAPRAQPGTAAGAGLPHAAQAQAAQDFVRRETLLDRSEHIAGYTFSLYAGVQDRASRHGAAARRAYDAALLTRLTQGGGSSLLGQRLAFVNLAAESLLDPLLDGMPAQNTVLMLHAAQPDSDWPALTQRAAELQARGFSVGLHIHHASALDCPLVGSAGFAQVDVAGFDGLALRELVASLRNLPGPGRARVRLVARNLQSHDEFRFSEKCGFDYFQGAFVGLQRGPKTAVSGGINRMVVLPILNLVRADASFAVIAERLKNEPTLTYKLLRYLNSPAMGLHMQVQSLTEALVLIGREKFYRWMSLLLFDFTNPSYRERTLTERALTRGRTLELLAGRGLVPATPDLLFLAGLFSLLDVALDLPLAELLTKAALPQAVSSALLGQDGPLAQALRLVALGEADTAPEPERMALALAACGLDDKAYALAATEALVWAHAAMGDSE